MDDARCQQFFQQPTCSAQHQYEALRAVFLDGLSQKNAAETPVAPPKPQFSEVISE